MTKKYFNKSEKWDCVFLYEILLIDNKKYLKPIFKTDRGDGGHFYLSYYYYIFGNKMIDFDKLLEWDVYYGICELVENINEIECHPSEAFDLVNRFMETGYEKMHLHEINYDTKPGKYYC